MKKRCSKEQFISNNENNNFIYTPNEHIPIGQVVETEDGAAALEIKKPGKKTKEIITVDELLGLIYAVKEQSVSRTL